MTFSDNTELTGLLKNEKSWMIALTQTSAYLKNKITFLNWCGFYLYDKKNNVLKLGPYQGKLACTEIPLTKGVCGKAATLLEIQVVPDVNLFPGHIACDFQSQSELVVPLFIASKFWGVCDFDSPIKGRFNEYEEGLNIQKELQTAFDQSALTFQSFEKMMSSAYS